MKGREHVGASTWLSVAQAGRSACQIIGQKYCADRGSDEFAPEIGHNVNAELGEQKAAEDRAEEADDQVAQESARCMGDPGREPADD